MCTYEDIYLYFNQPMVVASGAAQRWMEFHKPHLSSSHTQPPAKLTWPTAPVLFEGQSQSFNLGNCPHGKPPDCHHPSALQPWQHWSYFNILGRTAFKFSVLQVELLIAT
jgi:hypothetical protein